MVRTLFAAAAFAALSATPAFAQAQQSFVQDGVRYQYTVSAQGDATVYEGTANGETFRYVQRGNRVNGVIGGQSVSFETRKSNPLFAQR